MLLTGIIGYDSKMQTAQLIYSLLTANGIRASMIDTGNLGNSSVEMSDEYFKELERNEIEFIIVKINPEYGYGQIFNKLKFDILIYNDMSDETKDAVIAYNYDKVRKLFSLLDKKGTAIINADNGELLKVLEGMKSYVVTYGFNPKASITTSSVGDEINKNSMMCCLQRTLTTRKGKGVEPQEYIIKAGITDAGIYNILAVAAFALINDINLNIL